MTKESKKVQDMLSQETDMVLDDKLTTDNIESLLDLVESGPLYIDPIHKKPGYVYEFISNAPGEIEKKLRLGYEVVIDTLKVGQEKASTTHKFGSAVTVQSKCGQLLVLMAVSKERFDLIMAARAKKSRERDASLGKIDGVPDEYQKFQGQAIGEYKKTVK
jgi:hypothetical protein